MPNDPDDDRWREYHVSPRYLAGSSGIGDPGFEPVADWPHHRLDDGPCQLLVTSPDARIRIGWFGDDFDLWKITAAEDAVATPRWTATFTHTTPPEIVAGLTTALAHDWYEGNDRFLLHPAPYTTEAIQPFLDAGWTYRDSDTAMTIAITAPDDQTGLVFDRYPDEDDVTWTLWAGPDGWDRTEAIFTSATPAHLIAATATAWTDPAPVIRERHMLNPRTEHFLHLQPLTPDPAPAPGTPTPLDVRRTAVAAALQRAADRPDGIDRSNAARLRTTTPAARTTKANAPDTTSAPVAALPRAPGRSR